jgi:hypothetical protein
MYDFKQFRRDELILPGSTAHDDDNNDRVGENQDTLKITFKHSSSAAASSNKRKAKLAAFIPDADSQVDPSSSSVVSSPSEIFRKFRNPTTTTDSSGAESRCRSPMDRERAPMGKTKTKYIFFFWIYK